jgi:hypothetical protein
MAQRVIVLGELSPIMYQKVFGYSSLKRNIYLHQRRLGFVCLFIQGGQGWSEMVDMDLVLL